MRQPSKPGSTTPRQLHGKRCPLFLADTATSPILILLAGDIKANPGPFCWGCARKIHCDISPIDCPRCRRFFHMKCTGLTRHSRNLLKASCAVFARKLTPTHISEQSLATTDPSLAAAAATSITIPLLSIVKHAPLQGTIYRGSDRTLRSIIAPL